MQEHGEVHSQFSYEETAVDFATLEHIQSDVRRGFGGAKTLLITLLSG